MRAASLFTLITTIAISGCSIKQTVTPATLSAELAPEICMIPALNLRAGFTSAYQASLVEKGFRTRLMAPGSSPDRCALATTYIGRWGWDLALYMKHADIRVYEQGRQVGQAEYDARWGGGRLDKFISAEDKIAELTHQLFPNGAASLGRTAPEIAGGSAPLSKAAYRQQQLDRLMGENLSYEDYQRRYHELMAE
ncbi:Sbal_3080 family lipoprotein [Stutzerimonas nitrititolerans]|uniref:Sbal_3080 family lipoprotein n=1 Tax=Stutzerimonas nitrititolerans TaxID=2482751 RepID=UPI00289F6763|nr:Sbal_3080 family lipoprotein [Stutzerimonas nitrititolerans]